MDDCRTTGTITVMADFNEQADHFDDDALDGELDEFDEDADAQAEEIISFADSVERDLAANLSLQPVMPSEFADMSDFDEEDWDDWGDEPDPGCPHPWYRLDFISDDLGLGCSRCGSAWLLDDEGDAQEALLVVWQAARIELEQSASRHEAMAAVVEQLSGKRHCRACDVWGESDAFVDVDGVATCRHHLGADLAQMDNPALRLEAVCSFMVDQGWMASADPLVQWTLERNILEFPPIGETVGRVDELLPDIRMVLDARTADVLGIPTDTCVGQAASALAGMLGLDEPSARPSLVFLLGIIAQVDVHFRGAERPELDRAASEAIPVHGTHRAIIVMDLCRSDMPSMGTFTGDMADDLVSSVALRAAEVFLSDSARA